jgi:hypothetical protein
MQLVILIPGVASNVVQESRDAVLNDPAHKRSSLGDVSEVAGKWEPEILDYLAF